MSFLENMGTTEILIIAAILLLLFGSKKITELARGLGESGKEIKKAKRELTKAMDDKDTEEEIPEAKEPQTRKVSLKGKTRKEE